ncbi:MAG TPA: hypothetical protein VMV81_10210 [Phycisphaerae bacterium]|nr:hypothetical protein [Phycisphaerae bacterium]
MESRNARTPKYAAPRLWFAILLLFVGGRVFAQSPTPESTPLADQQSAVRDRVARLEDRMYQISQAIRKSEPEKASRLLESLGASRGMAVRQKMEEITKKLRGSQFSDATQQQEAVLADLQNLLKMMIEEPDKLAERRKEIDRLQAIRQRVDEIVKEQRSEKAEAEKSATTPAQAKAMEQALNQTKDLLNQQKAFSEKTSQPGAKPSELMPEQARLKAETEELAEQMKQIPGQPAAEDLSAASQRMQAAHDWLSKEQTPDAVESQKEAEEKLEAAIQKLQEQIKKLDAKKSLPEQAKQQKETAGKSQSLSKDMKAPQDGDSGSDSQPQGDSKDDKGKESEGDQGKSQKGKDQEQKGKQQGGEKSKEQGGEKGPDPQDVEKASKAQEGAAKDLEESKPKDAIKKQEEALKALEKAQEDLKQTLEQLRKEQQEEMLAALEARFRAMLALQVEVSKATQRLTDLARDQWKRSDQLELGELSPKQKEVGDEADKTLYILTEEGSTVVFPQIVQQIRDDGRDAATRLAAADPGSETRRLQTGIEQALRELIDAVKKKQEENQNGDSGSQGNNPDQPQPLLPGSAELKLLRSCQVRVNQATRSFHDEAQGASLKPETIQERIDRLAKRQEQVSKMAKEMSEALTKAQ